MYFQAMSSMFAVIFCGPFYCVACDIELPDLLNDTPRPHTKYVVVFIILSITVCFVNTAYHQDMSPVQYG